MKKNVVYLLFRFLPHVIDYFLEITIKKCLGFLDFVTTRLLVFSRQSVCFTNPLTYYHLDTVVIPLEHQLGPTSVCHWVRPFLSKLPGVRWSGARQFNFSFFFHQRVIERWRDRPPTCASRSVWCVCFCYTHCLLRRILLAHPYRVLQSGLSCLSAVGRDARHNKF